MLLNGRPRAPPHSNAYTGPGINEVARPAPELRRAASQDASKRKQVQAAIAAASQKPLPRPPQLEDSQKPLPRSARKRPTSLALSTTNGRSVLPSPLLKQRICSARSSSDTSATLQIAAPDRREPLPPTPTTPIASLVMGNAHSGSPSPDDDASMRSVVHVRRDSRLLSRKGSSNLFKRIDSRSPLPRDVTASVMSMIHRDGAKKDHSGLEDDGLVGVTMDHYSKRPDPHSNHYPGRPSGTRMVPSTTTIMITESRTNLPPSASEPVRDFSAPDSEPNDHTTDFPCIEEPQPDPEKELLENISPTIPAPSPLPEDSPHKYGLRDSANTPPVPHATQDIQLPKARRKSSGLEIFKQTQEAQTLQQAQSFLNGLSTARRRAESVAATRTDTTNDSWCNIAAHDSRPASPLPHLRPTTVSQDGEDRRRGHNFKSSGFAYTRPLTLAQIKCYRGHAKLLLSRNRHAPVECAVCHIDDQAEHFSCSWCALRMCKYCRNDLAERGICALKERIKIAEMGNRVDSVHGSSDESLQDLGEVTSKST
ncbi:hypothetical protein SMMN14_00704 [Sphaerulina musiva]